MNHKREQEQEERYIVCPILRQLGLSFDSILDKKDKPDIRVRLKNGDVVGIEITHYVVTHNKETQGVLFKLFEEYSAHLKNLTNENYQVGVLFKGLDYPDYKLNQYKENIFREIDSFIPGMESYIPTKYIDIALFYPSPNINNHTAEITAFDYRLIDEQKLIDIIDAKERKLNQYKEQPTNSNIKEYWLAIYLGTEEHTNFDDFCLNQEYQTSYNRIYLVNTVQCKQIL